MPKRKSGHIRPHPKLDLHGVFHSEVFEIVDKFIGDCIVNSNSDKIEIVTGYSKEMKSRVREVLSDYKLEGTEPTFNTGTLIVNME